MAKYLTLDGLQHFWDGVKDKLNLKVDKVEGKGLSSNDFTNSLKSNYDAAYTHSQAVHAPSGAQANVIETVQKNGAALTVTNKTVNVTVPTKVSELENDSGYTAITVDGALSDTSTNPVQNKAVKAALDAKAPLKSPAFTDTPTAPTAAANTNTTQIATTAFVKAAVDALLGASEAMIFKGTLGTGGTVTALPASHKAGDTYKVIAAATYAGVVCEIGDMIICVTTGTTANDAHWSVVQANVDGAVTGPTSAVTDTLPLFNGTTGKVIKASGKTIATSITGSANVPTDLAVKTFVEGKNYLTSIEAVSNAEIDTILAS